MKQSNGVRKPATISVCLFSTCPWKDCKGQLHAVVSVWWTGICQSGVTSFSIRSYRDKLMEAGAQGLISKEDSNQLAQAIERLCGGSVMEGFESPALANLRISREDETSPQLTVREEQIISLCADGLLDREIAEQLDISESTVRKHMQSILKKLNCKTARQAVALWVRSHAV